MFFKCNVIKLKCKRKCEVAQSCPTLHDPMNCSLPGSSVHGDPPGNNTGVGCHFLLQGIFPTQGSNLGLPHCRCTLYPLRHQGRLEIDNKIEIDNNIIKCKTIL